MKVCLLQGGLGNQMFQYAMVRALEYADRNIYLDKSFLEKNMVSTDTFTARGLELNIFRNLRANYLTYYQQRRIKSKGFVYKVLRFISNSNFLFIEQADNEFVELPSVKNLYLEGYFQSQKYFKSIRKDLITDFEFPELDEKNKNIVQKIRAENAVSIHVRHGDYLNMENNTMYHGILPLSYYREAVSLLEKSVDNPAYYIFSDDIEYVSENFDFISEKHIIDWNQGSESWKDMALMKECKYHIIANSSFSWWGAWLSECGGINIAPSKWFSDHVDYNISDFVPEDWQIITI